MTTASTREGSGAMFDGIARRYDLLNRVISLGIDQSWRRQTVAALNLRPGARVLDLATGTADLAIMVAKTEPEARVVGLDPSSGMLDVGREKIARGGLSDRVELVNGDAELSEPRGGIMGPFARFHIHTVVPTLGALLSGQREYHYLQRSIAAFPPAEEFTARIAAAGLVPVETRPLTFGVCHLYVAEAPSKA